jgi:hypothetical protein
MSSTPVVAPVVVGALDVPPLSALVAAAQQDHHGIPLATEVNPVARTERNPKLVQALAHRAGVAKVAQAHSRNALTDAVSSESIAKPSDPPGKRFNAVRAGVDANLLLVRHFEIVAYTLLLTIGDTGERGARREAKVPQTEQQKIRSRLRSYERKLRREKKEFGTYHDGAGKRYQIGPHYMLLGDNEGALEAFAWLEEEFDDDVGKPDHSLCWSLALYRAGNEIGAAKKLRQAMLPNL